MSPAPNIDLFGGKGAKGRTEITKLNKKENRSQRNPKLEERTR